MHLNFEFFKHGTKVATNANNNQKFKISQKQMMPEPIKLPAMHLKPLKRSNCDPKEQMTPIIDENSRQDNKNNYKHNRLNVGRIILERLVGALINCSLLQSGGGKEGEPKWD